MGSVSYTHLDVYKRQLTRRSAPDYRGSRKVSSTPRRPSRAERLACQSAGWTGNMDRKHRQPIPSATNLLAMDTTHLKTGDASRPETEPARGRRIAWEAERIAEARASLAAGRFVASKDVDAWIDSLDTDHELPPPRARRR